jgi:hypothetical protein
LEQERDFHAKKTRPAVQVLGAAPRPI